MATGHRMNLKACGVRRYIVMLGTGLQLCSMRVHLVMLFGMGNQRLLRMTGYPVMLCCTSGQPHFSMRDHGVISVRFDRAIVLMVSAQ